MRKKKKKEKEREKEEQNKTHPVDDRDDSRVRGTRLEDGLERLEGLAFIVPRDVRVDDELVADSAGAAAAAAERGPARPASDAADLALSFDDGPAPQRLLHLPLGDEAALHALPGVLRKVERSRGRAGQGVTGPLGRGEGSEQGLYSDADYRSAGGAGNRHEQRPPSLSGARLLLLLGLALGSFGALGSRRAGVRLRADAPRRHRKSKAIEKKRKKS